MCEKSITDNNSFFLQTCECQALQEEVANLKQQLSDALELGDMRSITSHIQQNEEKVIQAQVKFPILLSSSPNT